MIKKTVMFSAHTIHMLHLFVRSFFIAVALLLFAFFFWLIHGIEIDKLDIGRYKIDGLYIKLDKKLTLKAKEITLPQTKADPSFRRVEKTFDEIKYLLRFFERIMLEKINFKNNHFAFFYGDDVIYISSDDYEIAGNIERQGSKIVADIPVLLIKKGQIRLSGRLTYHIDKKKLETGGRFDALGIQGHFRAVQNDNEVVYAINTKKTDDIRPLIRYFRIPTVIESWVVEKVKAKRYKLAYLKGRLHVKKQKVRMDFASLKAKAFLEDVDIRFHKALGVAHAKGAVVRFEKGNLSFDLQEPLYEGRDLKGTTVVIKHITGPQPTVLMLDLKVISPMDDTVAKVLDAYGLDIPVRHTGVRNHIRVRLKIPLGKKHQQKPPQAYVDIALSRGRMTISGFPLHIKGGEVTYKEGRVTLRRIKVDEPWYHGEIDGTVSIAKKKADLLLKIGRLTIGAAQTPMLVIKDRAIPLIVTYRNRLEIALPTLNAQLDKKGDMIRISLSRLDKIIALFEQNPLGWDGGSLKIESRDMKRYSFEGNIQKDICFFYDTSGVCYTRIPIKGVFDAGDGQINLYAFGDKLHLNSAKRRIWINALHIDLKRFLQEIKNYKGESDRTKALGGKNFVVIGKKSHLRYGPYRLVTDSYDIEISPKGDIRAIGSVDGDVVKFNKKGERFFLQALRVKDTMLHPFINFKGLKHGRYSLKMEGDPDKMMQGRIIIEGGILSDFKAYSNTLAFINTLPALATLHSPGFSDKGFKIIEGVIKYRVTPKKIIFDSIYLKGNSATVAGKGQIDLVTKKIDVKLAIMTIRELGKVVGNIPLLGYILMGDDQSMTIGLQVKGTLDDPTVSTTVAKDILTLPLEILKRAVTAPSQLGTSRQSAPTDIPSANKSERDRKKANGGQSTPKIKAEEPIRSSAPSTDRSGQLF